MWQLYLKSTLITLVLSAFAIPGFVLKKTNMLGDGAKRTLSNLLLYVCQPALMISSFCVFESGDYEAILAVGRTTILINFAITAAIALVAMLAIFGACKLFFVKYKNRDDADIFTCVAVFSNCGFVGIPFIKAFTDGDALAVMYVAVFNLVFIAVSWTLGVYLISHDAKNISAKKIFLNPSIISSAVALLLFFVPEINFFMFDACKELQTIPSALSTMVAPVSMMLIGIIIADTSPKTLFCNRGVYLSGALRLVFAPALAFCVALLFRAICGGYASAASLDCTYVFLAPVVALAMAPASIVVAMSERFDRPNPNATASVVTNTLLSIVTIPLVMTAMLELWKIAF